MTLEKDTDIIVIKGSPASGKSETAKELTKYFPKGVRMEIDNLRSMVISVDWVNQNEHINILNISTKLTYEFFKLGLKPIIIIDTFSGDKIDLFYEKLKALNEVWKINVFGLYTSDEELEKRLKLRTSNQFKDFEITKRINYDTLKFKHINEFQIDTTYLKATETAKIIIEFVTKKNTSSQQSVKPIALKCNSKVSR